jgi:predicted protein tyrosine phosphatase
MSEPHAPAIIHVCSLSAMPALAMRVRASHLLTLVSNLDAVPTPAAIDPAHHLRLKFNDIEAPLEGYVEPTAAHVEQILAFAAGWHQEAPLVIHCWAGISRSTAAAFITLCALNSKVPEDLLAERLRAASPTASPNRLLVRHADGLLGRGGRMIGAIEAIGRGEMTTEGMPFELPARYAG